MENIKAKKDVFNKDYFIEGEPYIVRYGGCIRGDSEVLLLKEFGEETLTFIDSKGDITRVNIDNVPGFYTMKRIDY